MEQIGLEGKFDVSAFNAGLNTYLDGLARAEAATSGAVSALNSIDQVVNRLTTSSANLGSSGAIISGIANDLSKLSSVSAGSQLPAFLSNVEKALTGFGSGGNLDAATTQLNDLAFALNSISRTSIDPARLSAVSKGINDLVGGLSKTGNLSAVTNTLGTLSTTLGSLSTLKFDATGLSAIQKVMTSLSGVGNVQAVPAGAIASIQGLTTALTGLGALPNIGNIGGQIGRIATALGALGTIQPIPAAALTSIGGLNQVLTGLAALPTIGNIGGQIGRVASALQVLGTVQAIPANVLTSITGLNQVLTGLASLPNVGSIGSQIGRVASALGSLSALQPIPSQTVSSITNFTRSLTGLTSLANLGSIGSQLGRLSTSLQGLGTLVAIPSSVTTSISKFVQSIQGLSGLSNLGQIGSGISGLSSGLAKLASIPPINAAVIRNVEQLGKSLGNIASGVNITGFVSQLNSVSNQLKKFDSDAATTARSASQLGVSLRDGLALGFGIQAVSMFTNLANSIQSAGAQALTTVAFFERLGFTIQSIVADGFRAADSTLSMAESLEKAQRPAEAVQRVLDKISIASPFTPQEVARTFQIGAAYGIEADQMLRLTQAYANVSASRGLSADQMQRISLAIAQIQAKGKLAGQEILQLADAGVNIRQILAEAFNVTGSELNKMMEDGAIPANDVINAVVTSFERLDGEAQRAAFTLTGLFSTFGEISQLAQRDLFGSLLAPLQPLLESFVKFASDDSFGAALQIIGGELGQQAAAVIQQMTEAVNGLIVGWQNLNPNIQEGIIVFGLAAAAVVATVVAIGGLELVIGGLLTPFTVLIGAVGILAAAWVENFGGIQSITYAVLQNVSDAFATVANAAIGWGQNIIDSLAQGISGAVDLILQALSIVGQAIAYMLEPGSPPRLLPDLDKWGAGAASAYLEGFKDADFSFLDQFGGLLANRIRNLSSAGDIDEGSVADRLFGTRTAIAQAIQQIQQVGTVSEATIKTIADNAEVSTASVSAYLQGFINVRDATEQVDAAQQALNSTLKRYDDQINPLQKHLDSLKKAQQNAEDTKKIAQLNRIINNQGISDARRKQAQLELDEILTQQKIDALTEQKEVAQEAGQAEVDSKTSVLEAAKEQLDVFQKQTAEALNLQGIYSSIAKATSDLAAAGADRLKKLDAELDPLKKQLEALNLQKEALRDHVREAELKAILNDKDATAAEKAAAALELQTLEINKQIRAVEAARLAEEGFAVDLEAIERIPVVLADIEKGVKKVKGAGKDGKPILESVFGDFKGMDQGKINKALTDFEATVDRVRGKIETFTKSFDPMIEKINTALPSFLSLKERADGTVPAIEALKTAFEGFAVFFASTRLIAILQNLPTILGSILTKSNVVGAAITLFALAWSNDWGGIQEKTRTAVDAIKNKFTELTGIGGIEDVKTKLQEFAKSIQGYFNNPDTLGGKATGFIKTFVEQNFSKDAIEGAKETVRTQLSEFFGVVQGYFNDPSTVGGKVAAKATEAVGYIEKWVAENFTEEKVNTALQTVSSLLSTFFPKVQAYFDDPTTVGGAGAAGVKVTISFIEKWVNENFSEENVAKALAKATTASTSFLAEVNKILNAPPGKGQGNETGGGAKAEGMLDRFMETNFGSTAVGRALAFLANEWVATADIIVADLIKPLQDAFDKDTGEGIGTRMANFLIRGFGIAVGATIEWILGVFIPKLVLALGAIAQGIIWLATVGVPYAVAYVSKALTDGFDGIVNYLQTDAVQALKDAGQSISDGFNEGMQRMFDALGLGNFQTKFDQFKFDIRLAFYALELFFKITLPARFSNAMDDLITAIVTSGTNFLTTSGIQSFITMGGDLIAGLMKGLKEKVDELKETDLITALQGLYDAILTWFGIASPSTKISEGVGKPIGEGLIGGVVAYLKDTANISTLTTSFTDLVTSIFSVENIKKFTDEAYKLGESILSSIKSGLSSIASAGGNFISGLFGGGDAEAAAASGATSDTAKQISEAFTALEGAVNTETLIAALTQVLTAFTSLQTDVTTQMNTLKDNVVLALVNLNIGIQLPLLDVQITFSSKFQFIQEQVAIKMLAMHTDTNTRLDLINVDAVTKITDMTTKIIALFDKMRSETIRHTENMKTGVLNAIDSLKTDMLSKLAGLKDDVVKVFTDMKDQSIAEIEKLKTGLETAISNLVTSLETTFADKGYELGSDFGMGIAEGIRSKIDEIKRAAASAAQAAESAAGSALETASPSKVAFRELGKPFSQGIAKGILADINQITAAATRVAMAGVDAAQMIANRTGTVGNNISTVSTSRTNVFNLNVTSNQSSRGIQTDFGVMQVMAA